MKLKQLLARDEIVAWQGVFRCGANYFAETEALGLGLDPMRDAEALREAAREPWGRLGRRYLAEFFKAEADRPKPWALIAFGEPD